MVAGCDHTYGSFTAVHEVRLRPPDRNRDASSCASGSGKGHQSFDFPAALILAQRAFAMAESFARAAEETVFFLRIFPSVDVPALTLAQRAFAPAAILARPAADIFRF